jgi:hypothetical protein
MSHKERTSGAELPSAKELTAILTKESPRLAVRYDFLDNNAFIFDIYKEVSALAGSDDTWINSYKAMSMETLIDKMNKNRQEIAEYIQTNQNLTETYENLYTRLVPPQDDSISEALFVFGAASNARIEHAVNLYKQGVSPKIIISGHQPHYEDAIESEAIRMAKFAQNAGVPISDLILEENAITIPDNVKRGIDLLIALDWKPASITLVATDFILSRAKMDWYKFTPWNTEIKVTAPQARSPSFTKEGWYKDSKTIALVLNEYAKLVLETKVDLIQKDLIS